VVITSYRETCSACGQLLTGEENPFEHECIKGGDAFIQVESFTFNRVDFINAPAYPQAGLLEIAADAQRAVVPMELLASVYTSQSLDHLGWGAGPPGDDPEARSKRRKSANMSEKTLQDAKAKIEELQSSVAALTAERDTLKAKVENPVKDPELEAVKTELEAIKKERHNALVAAAVDTRFKAALIAKKDEEAERITSFTDDYLRLLAEDAAKVAAKLVDATPTGPKAQYEKGDSDEFAAALEASRKQMYGYTRDANGNVVR
jgi:signal transduction protein with GAF and PtsI domain